MTLYKFLRGLLNIIFRIIFRININGEYNIPKEGNLLICANHINLLDPIVLALTTKRQIFFMAKKELFENKIFKWILLKVGAFPVDRDGSDVSAIKTALRVLKNDDILGIFPEGTRVDEFNLDNAKPGIAMLALKGKSKVLPVYLDADYKLFGKIVVNIGEILDYSDKYGVKLSSEEYKEISEDILSTIYSLKDKK